jgi:hypothetical protein
MSNFFLVAARTIRLVSLIKSQTSRMTESRGLRRRGRRPAAGLDTAVRPATKREREADGTRKGRWPRRRREAEAAETTAVGRRAAGALTGASAAIETARRWRTSLCELDGIHSTTTRGGQVSGAGWRRWRRRGTESAAVDRWERGSVSAEDASGSRAAPQETAPPVREACRGSFT